jgi:hypothetical protein
MKLIQSLIILMATAAGISAAPSPAEGASASLATLQVGDKTFIGDPVSPHPHSCFYRLHTTPLHPIFSTSLYAQLGAKSVAVAFTIKLRY